MHPIPAYIIVGLIAGAIGYTQHRSTYLTRKFATGNTSNPEPFKRRWFGHKTKQEAEAAAKIDWKAGYVVQVTQEPNGKWYVWYR